MSVIASGLFSCRIWFYDESLLEIEVWSDELIPMDLMVSGTAEWAKLHLENCHDSAGLREILGVPAEGDHQVFFKGKIIGTYCQLTNEFDEEFEVIGEVQQAPIPAEYTEMLLYEEDEVSSYEAYPMHYHWNGELSGEADWKVMTPEGLKIAWVTPKQKQFLMNNPTTVITLEELEAAK